MQNQATASNLFDGIEAVLDEARLEWSKVIGAMMDNCNVMRGQRNGVEALIKRKNPNHLDIHGDTVHIVNNAAKALVKPFHQYVEQITDDIFYDIQHQPKCKDVFQEICGLLGIMGATSLVRPIPSRFLQMIDVVERVSKLEDALSTVAS